MLEGVCPRGDEAVRTMHPCEGKGPALIKPDTKELRMKKNSYNISSLHLTSSGES